MKLTQKQKDNLRDLDKDTLIEVLHECAESLGLMTIGQYHEYIKIPKRTVYENAKNRKLKCITFCENLLIIMNYESKLHD